MKTANLYLLTFNEIYIFGHIGLQIQGDIVHSENQGFFAKIEMKSPKITLCNNR